MVTSIELPFGQVSVVKSLGAGGIFWHIQFRTHRSSLQGGLDGETLLADASNALSVPL